MADSESLGRCVVCDRGAGVLYPMLRGSPAFCSAHHNPKDAGPFGCDFSGPDDFDVPVPDDCSLSAESFSKETFAWKDRSGSVHKLVDIDDAYLVNIIGYLGKRIACLGNVLSRNYCLAVKEFLTVEARRRGVL